MEKRFRGSLRGSSIVKSTSGTDRIGCTLVAEGLCIEVQGMVIGASIVYQVSLLEKPGGDPRYVRTLTRGNL
jgi:hypothetical protein